MSGETPVLTIIFGDVELYLPKTTDAIVTARRLLDLVEDEIVSGWVCKHCGCTENMSCPGGCSWVAPNLCSACAEENAPEIPEHETLRNVSELSGYEKHADKLYLEGYNDGQRDAESRHSASQRQQLIESNISDVVQGNETEPGVESPAASSDIDASGSGKSKHLVAMPARALQAGEESRPTASSQFIFKECEQFKWFGLPTFRAGKTMYHLQQNVIPIMREGYGDVSIWASRDDIKYLAEHPADEIVNTAIRGLYKNKRYVLKRFLRDVEFSKIGCDEHRIQPGATQSKELPQNAQNDVKCPKCRKSDYSKWGTKKTSTGTKYNYYCKQCGKVFSSDQDVGRKHTLPKKEAVQTQSQIKDQLLDEPEDPDRAFKPFGLNRLMKTSGDGEKIEQEFMDDAARAQQ